MTESVFIRAGRIATPAGVIEDGAVLVEGERIVAVDHASRIPLPPSAVVYSCDVLLPGFIDMHVHGAAGHSFGAGTTEAAAAARAMARTGVTTCYAGLGAGPSLAAIAETVAAAAEAVDVDVDVDTCGARLAGVFMEGPFISVEKKGAWNPAHLRSPSIAELRELIAASGDRIRRVNVAPELPGALDFIREARALGLVVSIGHSNATYAQAVAGIEAGATIANHTFNAMSALDHRSPGMVGAVLLRDELLAELILDHVHVAPEAATILLQARGAAGVALITDGSTVAGMPSGTYEWGGRTLTVREDGSCRLPDGTLAGGAAGFDECLRHAVLLVPDLTQLAALAAGNAAAAMGIGEETGSIVAGRFADLALLSSVFEVQGTMVGGRMVYEKEDAPA